MESDDLREMEEYSKEGRGRKKNELQKWDGAKLDGKREGMSFKRRKGDMEEKERRRSGGKMRGGYYNNGRGGGKKERRMGHEY